MVLITLFSHDAFGETRLFPSSACHLHLFPPVPPPHPPSFLILFLHIADLKLTPEGVRWPRRSNAVTQPPLVSSFHPVLPPPRSSTSTSILMKPVKGFLPNLSALMFASVLSLTGGGDPKIKVR